NGMDEMSQKAINGRRNTDMIYNYISSNGRNPEKFRILVRTLKLWTKKRGIYGFKFCFLNGISIEILSAYYFNLYYDKTIIELLKIVFVVINDPLQKIELFKAITCPDN
ncbi:MAG: hypothetical protein IKB72_00985, partial [Ruminococcus sp.]|nr:hypothetical protein [Ruminococcus sp.]